ncbi:amidohydrolase family protein [Labrenzia sp. PHM005]|uniref:amidohydrolase family protein n=1 Tax=Labrenzia sp. PHM005 TaxID=2590016 RepID=UPI0011400568|nr:amidohydrolase family protein [Labrenzia sp. PHM005]QDG78322.1 amidohydrolase family protein [Labrenzia sp. PHM005]
MKRLLAALAMTFTATGVVAQDDPAQTLFTNVHIFDGVNEARIENANVLVEGNLIKTVSTEAIDAPGATVIDGKGGTLMPGFIDTHVHFALTGKDVSTVASGMTWEDIALGQAAMANMYLNEGFTTVRDAGAANAGLRRSIDGGFLPGPRFYSSGAFISARGGHGDIMPYNSTPYAATNADLLNMTAIVAGADDVLMRARNNFRMGATQIKVIQTGGVATLFDPWQLMGMTEAELAAAVEVADAYGSYVMAHSYTKEAIMLALEMGVKSCEHCFAFDEDIAKLMKEKGAYMTTNMTAFSPLLADSTALADPITKAKFASWGKTSAGFIDNVKKYKPKRAFQTDCVGEMRGCQAQNAYEKYLGGEFFGTYETLKSMTSVAGELVALSGEVLNPYLEGQLGVIEEGAYADILVIEGNPLEDLALIGAHPDWFGAEYRPDGVETIKVIMKDGDIYKNTLN